MNVEDPVALARLFQDVPRERILVALAAALSLCVAEGIYTEGELQPLVARWIGETSATSLVGLPVEELFSASASSRSEEIDALYPEVHQLAEAALSDPSQEARYRARLARLRELQALEAREMAEVADFRRHLSPGAFDLELTRVKALLIVDDEVSSA